MYLDRFAEAFAEIGLAARVFDNRNFGASDGEPRQEIHPWTQVRDYRDAITFADQALAAYEKALHPKELVVLEGGHFDAYVKDFDAAAKPACRWFAGHLLDT